MSDCNTFNDNLLYWHDFFKKKNKEPRDSKGKEYTINYSRIPTVIYNIFLN